MVIAGASKAIHRAERGLTSTVRSSAMRFDRCYQCISPINKYVIGLRATLSHPEEEILTLLSFYLSHPSAAVKKPLTSDAHFYHFISAGVGACGALLLYVMKEEESSRRFV